MFENITVKQQRTIGTPRSYGKRRELQVGKNYSEEMIIMLPFGLPLELSKVLARVCPFLSGKVTIQNHDERKVKFLTQHIIIIIIIILIDREKRKETHDNGVIRSQRRRSIRTKANIICPRDYSFERHLR